MAGDLAHIRRHWTILAAEAWRGYAERGRGAILLDFRVEGEPVAGYCTQLGQQHDNAWPSPVIAEQVRLYDPRCEVIFLVVRAPDALMTYRLEATTMPPPIAFARIPHIPRGIAA